MILFRAKIQGTEKWIKGFPLSIYGAGIDSIQDINNYKRIVYIEKNTLSQCVLINNNIYYDGDIIRCSNRIKNEILLIKFKIDGYFAGTDRLSKVLRYNNVDIIGNEIDNENLII